MKLINVEIEKEPGNPVQFIITLMFDFSSFRVVLQKGTGILSIAEEMSKLVTHLLRNCQ